MTLVDDRVLEFIREEGSGAPSQMMEEGPIYYSRGYIAKRCRTLDDKGLLKHLGNGVYILTEKGSAYLDEELDTEKWEKIDRDKADA